VYQPVLANVHVARAGAANASGWAFPARWRPGTSGNRARWLFSSAFILVVHLAFAFAERAKLAVAVVDDSHRCREPQLHRAAADHQSIVGIVDASADHGVDVDVKVGVLGQDLQLLVQYLQALFETSSA